MSRLWTQEEAENIRRYGRCWCGEPRASRREEKVENGRIIVTFRLACPNGHSNEEGGTRHMTALEIVIEAAERHARELLNQASEYAGRGMESISDETFNEHYKPLRDAIEAMRYPWIAYFPGDSKGRIGSAYGPYSKQEATIVASFLSIDPTEGETLGIGVMPETDLAALRERVNAEREKIRAGTT
jgi:hypothetical protein